MHINAVTAQKSQKQMRLAIAKLHSYLQNHEFLVGDQFTRADLAAASLLAPITMPDQYGLEWPDHLPSQLEDLIGQFNSQVGWVRRLYAEFR